MNMLGKLGNIGKISRFGLVAGLAGWLVAACGGSNASDAEKRGIGGTCSRNESCAAGLTCLSFKGGYCGLVGCTADTGCPAGSACVHHTNMGNYCFLVCADKSECNLNRNVANEANCVASVTFVDPHPSTKACVPPSSAN